MTSSDRESISDIIRRLEEKRKFFYNFKTVKVKSPDNEQTRRNRQQLGEIIFGCWGPAAEELRPTGQPLRSEKFRSSVRAGKSPTVPQESRNFRC